ncbi:MAG TPA: PEGA domain-containing protein [Burkholderiales bacterium]|nr:PEGA domain-containing protein [Burkholderiales bacterium]
MESAGRTLVCSVLFLDIADYSQKPVAEQLQLKQAFNQALAVALEHVAPRDRVILDTGDGAAITFMGDPEDALLASMAMRDLSAKVPVRLGVNLGPVRLVRDLNGQMNIIGDGINVAQRVMSFSRPGQLLVSRSFYEVVSCLSRDYANLFRHEGSRTDKHVRAHEVYAVVGATPSPRRLDQAHARSAGTPPGAAGWLAGTDLLGLRRTALVVAPVLFMFIVAGAVGARAMLPEPPPASASAAKPAAVSATPALQHAAALPPAVSVPPAPVAAADPAPAAKPPAPAAGGGAAVIEGKKKLVLARAESKPGEKPQSAGFTGRVELAVAPWGEVLVDGKSRGISPPLRVLELAPGTHTVEIRNSTFPAHVARVEVKPGEAVRIQYRFR